MIVKVWKNKGWVEPILKEVNCLERTELFLDMKSKNQPINPPVAEETSLTEV